MPRKAKIDSDGDTIQLPKAQVDGEITISNKQAKELTKKPLTEKQKENLNKLIEKNRERFAKNKEEKEALFKQRIEDEEKKAEVAKQKVLTVKVAPKVKKPRKVKEIVVVESESEDESDDVESEVEEVVVKKVKRKHPSKNPTVHDSIQEKIQTVKKIDELMNPRQAYMRSLISSMH